MNFRLALLRRQPQQAEAVLHDLADLYRALLSDARTLVPLGQELALARAYLPDAQFLILDEPTASLDPTATEAVERIVRAYDDRALAFPSCDSGNAIALAALAVSPAPTFEDLKSAALHLKKTTGLNLLPAGQLGTVEQEDRRMLEQGARDRHRVDARPGARRPPAAPPRPEPGRAEPGPAAPELTAARPALVAATLLWRVQRLRPPLGAR